MGHALAIQSNHSSMIAKNIFSNKPLLDAVLIVIILQTSITYIPFLYPIFQTETLSAKEFLLAIAVVSMVFFWGRN
jgi:Ca2+-transporting ATPase